MPSSHLSLAIVRDVWLLAVAIEIQAVLAMLLGATPQHLTQHLDEGSRKTIKQKISEDHPDSPPNLSLNAIWGSSCHSPLRVRSSHFVLPYLCRFFVPSLTVLPTNFSIRNISAALYLRMWADNVFGVLSENPHINEADECKGAYHLSFKHFQLNWVVLRIPRTHQAVATFLCFFLVCQNRTR